MSLITKQGLFKGAPATIVTYSGRTVNLLDPQPEDFDLNDIAHSLGMQCRWTGHTTKFYSVAEHCVLVSRIVPTLQALMHDASEAYLSDLCSPAKKGTEMGTLYKALEQPIEAAIAERFGLQYPWPKAVKAADTAMWQREAEKLVPHYFKRYMGPIVAPKGTPHPRCWTPTEAKVEFMFRFQELGGEE